MKDTPNHYILMLKLGVQALDNNKTINFEEMLQYLESYYNVNTYRLRTGELSRWFFEKFYEPEAEVYIQKARARGAAVKYEQLQKYFLNEAELRGDAYMEYIDYLELKEARESSMKAQNIAIAAIIISGVLALTSLVAQFWGG